MNFSELARDTGISVDTARRYFEYLKISYQTMMLYPFYENLTSSIIKISKIYWLDIGILRELTGYWDALITGKVFKTFVISEIYIITEQGQEWKLIFTWKWQDFIDWNKNIKILYEGMVI